MKIKIALMDKSEKTNQIKKYIKNLTVDNEELLKSLTIFTFVLVKVLVNRGNIKKLDNAFKDIKKELPKDLPRDQIVTKLKQIAKKMFTENIIDTFDLILTIDSVVKEITRVYFRFSNKTRVDTKDLKEQIKKDIKNQVFSYLLTKAIGKS